LYFPFVLWVVILIFLANVKVSAGLKALVLHAVFACPSVSRPSPREKVRKSIKGIGYGMISSFYCAAHGLHYINRKVWLLVGSGRKFSVIIPCLACLYLVFMIQEGKCREIKGHDGGNAVGVDLAEIRGPGNLGSLHLDGGNQRPNGPSSLKQAGAPDAGDKSDNPSDDRYKDGRHGEYSEVLNGLLIGTLIWAALLWLIMRRTSFFSEFGLPWLEKGYFKANADVDSARDALESHAMFGGSDSASGCLPLQRFTLVVDSFGPDGARRIESMSSIWCSPQNQVLSDEEAWSVVDGWRPKDYDHPNEWICDASAGDRVSSYLGRSQWSRNEAQHLPTDQFFLKLQKLLLDESDDQRLP